MDFNGLAPIDEQALLRTHRDLVAINSVNPRLEEGAPGEVEIAAYVEGFLRRHGVDVVRQPVEGDRHNIIGSVTGSGKRTLMLEAHMDTASVGIMTIPPFDPRLEDGRIYGRGACDTKGCLAAMLHAVVAYASRKDKRVDLVLAAVCDEESGQRGAQVLCDSEITADAAVIGEPTENIVACAHKGAVRGTLEVRGVAAHSSKPDLGINAIVGAAAIVLEIEKSLVPRLAERHHPLVGSPTINVGRIYGGVQVNFVPDRCCIEVDRRTIPGETTDQAIAELEAVLETVRQRNGQVDASLCLPFSAFPPVNTSPDHPIARATLQASGEMTGRGHPMGVPFCTDASTLATPDMPCVVLGPGSIDQAHGAVEWITTEQLITGAAVYLRAIHYYGELTQ